MTENGHHVPVPNGLRTGVGRDSPDQLTGRHCEEPPALNVRVEPFGPIKRGIDQSVRALLEQPRVLELVLPGEHRLL